MADIDYAYKLERLEYLRKLVNQYIPKMHNSGEECKRMLQEICEIYGQVADVFEVILGKQSIEVPSLGSCPNSIYPNYFEAGFLSGWSTHSHQGMTELLKVIGKVKSLVNQSIKGSQSVQAFGKRVFIVHGHNEAQLQTCARFIEKLGLPLTILREQSNQGRTIIEKFIDHADVGFAVVLLTADDRGGSVEIPYKQQQKRARQNVMFELGFFIGKLGRNRVCALYEDGVEIPSDYKGVAFVPLDPNMAWQMVLAKEMKAAGLPVDMNKVV
jgi:predicted nucleotide-binding protein